MAKRWGNIKDMFALIIGIDSYLYASKLKGAVADANRVESFLTNKVKVKEGRIITLRNEEATRTGIEDAFRSLWEKECIKPDDPIIIYFAGHGCKILRPTHWVAGGKKEIEGIFPYDVQPQEETRAIFPIPDRTIATWLNILSYKKGNNITVIFDCCHSASGARGEELERTETFDGSLPEDIDKKYFEIFEEMVPQKFLNQHSLSHVFLAACGADESAREAHGKGKFTEELLKALEQPGVDRLTFVEFMKRLEPIKSQTPQCEGHFKDRILFSNILKIGSGVFPVSREHTKDTYRIEAGLTHGVNKDSWFNMYETAAIDTASNKLLCTLRAEEVFWFYTIATVGEQHYEEILESGVARQVCSGNPLAVHFTPALPDAVKQDKVLHNHDIRRRVEVVDAKSADFIIDMGQEDVAFTITLKAVTDHSGTSGLVRQLPAVVGADTERVVRVLHAASRWKQHLDIPSSSQEGFIKNILVEFFPLERTRDDMGVPVTRPKDATELKVENNSVYLDVTPNNSDLYGMNIRNNTRLDLHCSILMFEIDDLSIAPRFTGPIGVQSNGNADPPLPQGNYLPIGYGNGGELPFSFEVAPGDVSVTILKLYLTTIPMDLGWLKQVSPFSEDTARVSKSDDTLRQQLAPDPQGASMLFTIVQRGPLS